MGLSGMTKQEKTLGIMNIVGSTYNKKIYTHAECIELIQYLIDRCSENCGHEIKVEFKQSDAEPISIEQARDILNHRMSDTEIIPFSVIELIRKLFYQDHYSKSKIADDLGISRHTVYKYIKED